jgi:glucan phosphorylase
MTAPPVVAYFSMEIGLESPIPTYAGGLGILAGDTLRSAADLEVPMVAVTLLHRQGYFYQRLDAHGRQSEEPVSWSVDDYLDALAPRVTEQLAAAGPGAPVTSGFDRDVLTLGFARRATAYKRALLLFHDLPRLRALAAQQGPLQVVFAGKAHPRDAEGKKVIQAVHEARDALQGSVSVAYLANYDMDLAKLVCAGVDVWLNTPLPPREASARAG